MLAKGYNHVVGYGQSLSTGWEGWPAISRAPGRAWMVGCSVRAANGEIPADRWVASGDGAIRPLVATVQKVNGAFCDDAHVGQLTGRTNYLGETPLEAACNSLAARVPDPEMRILASAAGVGGKTLAELSCGARPEIFNRLRACCLAAKAAAGAVGQPYTLAALMLLQGESDYVGHTSRTLYGEQLRRLLDDVDAFARLDLGQQGRVPVFSYQTSSRVAVPGRATAVAQAQLDLAETSDRFHVVGPCYFVPDNGVHLDANGYRWLGSLFGKVLVRVLVDAREWQPLSPNEVRRVPNGVEIEFHVPVAPLAWDVPFRGASPVAPKNRGFRITRGAAEIPLVSVDLAGDRRVSLTFADDASGPLTVSYADGGDNHGAGALRDSDAVVSDDVHPFDASKGHRPEADIPWRVGRPYPLANWCVAFSREVGGA